MKLRHVSRELALLCLCQVGNKNEKIDDLTIDELILHSIRTLVEFTDSNLKNALTDILKIQELLEEEELNNPVNLELPIDAEIKPVNITNTKHLKEITDILLQSVEYITHSNEIAEFNAITQFSEVKKFTHRLINICLDKQNEIDKIIDQYSEGWQIDRLIKMDKIILRLAVAEISYMADVPKEVSADEAIELAKKYSSEDSPKFINGILGQFISDLSSSKL